MRNDRKYVIFSHKEDYYKMGFSEVLNLPNVDYVGEPLNGGDYNKVVRSLNRIHFSQKINSVVELPFKSIWNKKIYSDSGSYVDYCFIVFMNWLHPQYKPLFKYLHNAFKGSKLILYFEDVVASRKHISMDIAEKYFDEIVTFDKNDSEKYDFHYYPAFMSRNIISENNSIKESDVFFIGNAKKRYNAILEFYNFFAANGIKADFIVSKLQDGEQRVEGINYVSQEITYSEYLQHLQKSNCILEIIQGGSDSPTSRTIEALLYGKKLVSTNVKLKEMDFFDDEQMLSVQSAKEIPIDFIREHKSFEVSKVERYTPTGFLSYIDTLV